MSRGNGQRGTKAEKRRRVQKVRHMILSGFERGAIILAAQQLGWNVSDRTVDGYMATARRGIEQSSADEQSQELALAKMRLVDLYAKEMAAKDYRGALPVLREYNELCGLHAPKRVEITLDSVDAEIARLEAEVAAETASRGSASEA